MTSSKPPSRTTSPDRSDRKCLLDLRQSDEPGAVDVDGFELPFLSRVRSNCGHYQAATVYELCSKLLAHRQVAL